MKKFLAVLFSVVIIATFMVVPAMAESSPVGEVVHKVEVISTATGEEVTSNYEVKDGETITLTKEDSEYEFKGWVITGDYEIVTGTLTSDEIVVRPLTDLVVKANYDVEDAEQGETNDSDKAPQTGNGMLMVTVLLTAGAFVAMVATKKAVRA